MRSLPDLKLTVMLFEPTVKALAATGRRTVSEATRSPNGVIHLAIDRIGIPHRLGGILWLDYRCPLPTPLVIMPAGRCPIGLTGDEAQRGAGR
jgi:hypothetical protein